MKKIDLDKPQKVRAIGNGAHVFVPKALVGRMIVLKLYRQVAAQIAQEPKADEQATAAAEIPNRPLPKEAPEHNPAVRKLEDPDVEAERHFLECLKNAKNSEIRAKLIRTAEKQFGKERVKVLVDALK